MNGAGRYRPHPGTQSLFGRDQSLPASRGRRASTPETTSSTISCNSIGIAPSRAWTEMPCMTADKERARRCASALAAKDESASAMRSRMASRRAAASGASAAWSGWQACRAAGDHAPTLSVRMRHGPNPSLQQQPHSLSQRRGFAHFEAPTSSLSRDRHFLTVLSLVLYRRASASVRSFR